VPGPLAAIVFDVGETIVDETRFYAILADHLGVPRLTFFAIAGAMIARGGTHRDAFELFRPGIDLQAELDRLGEAGQPVVVSLDDLYPDALPCLRELASAGYRLGIAANQPEATAHVLAELDIPLELIATSAGWGIRRSRACAATSAASSRTSSSCRAGRRPRTSPTRSRCRARAAPRSGARCRR